MGLILILILVVLGWAETATFSYFSNEFGGLLTLLGIFVTATMGIALLKNQGLSVLNRIRNDLLKGQPPVSSIADSISLLIGGVLMLIPGYLTDVVGLFLFIPGLRTFTGIYFIKWFTNIQKFNGFVNLGDNIFQARDGHHSKTNDKNNSFRYDKKYHHHKNFDDVIEGNFEEQVKPRPIIQQNKTDER